MGRKQTFARITLPTEIYVYIYIRLYRGETRAASSGGMEFAMVVRAELIKRQQINVGL